MIGVFNSMFAFYTDVTVTSLVIQMKRKPKVSKLPSLRGIHMSMTISDTNTPVCTAAKSEHPCGSSV